MVWQPKKGTGYFLTEARKNIIGWKGEGMKRHVKFALPFIILCLFIALSHDVFGRSGTRGFGIPKGSLVISEIPILIPGETGKEIGIIVTGWDQ